MSEAGEVRTRSGRLVKKPQLYTPEEIPVDDYTDYEYDTQEEFSGDESDDYCETDSEEEEDDPEDMDENGNLKGFVVDSDEESCSSESEEDLFDEEEEEGMSESDVD